MTEQTILDALEKMEKAVEHVQTQFTTIRTGRATPALVEKLQVEYYGSTVPLQQLAGFQVGVRVGVRYDPADPATVAFA